MRLADELYVNWESGTAGASLYDGPVDTIAENVDELDLSGADVERIKAAPEDILVYLELAAEAEIEDRAGSNVLVVKGQGLPDK